MADLIDLKIQNAMLSIKPFCDWKVYKSQNNDIDWNNGHIQYLEINSSSMTINFLNGKQGCQYILILNTSNDLTIGDSLIINSNLEIKFPDGATNIKAGINFLGFVVLEDFTSSETSIPLAYYNIAQAQVLISIN